MLLPEVLEIKSCWAKRSANSLGSVDPVMALFIVAVNERSVSNSLY